MTPRITFEQAIAFAIDRGALSLWCQGEDLRYTALRRTMSGFPPFEQVNGYMKLAAPVLTRSRSAAWEQLELDFSA